MKAAEKPRVVISGVNLVEAGPLAVFRDALDQLARHFSGRFEIIALVHRRDLIDVAGVTYLEFPQVKSSWLSRVRFEYWDCRALSRGLRPYLWLAMHDMTPNVTATVRAVYCHNPAPFYRLSLHEALMDWKLMLFSIFYRLLYAINIRRNQFVIVQQGWLRAQFRRLYGVREVVVAHPSILPLSATATRNSQVSRGDTRRFIYPAFPRVFKNFEVVLEAVRLLENRGCTGFEVFLTIAGTENSYSAGLFSRYRELHSIRWLGLLPRERIFELYSEADCLLFPSRLETWGMPVSEFKQTAKPMLVADLPYAHETVGDYDAVQFFPPNDAGKLADSMEALIQGRLRFEPVKAAVIAPPFAENWADLFHLLLGDGPQANP